MALKTYITSGAFATTALRAIPGMTRSHHDQVTVFGVSNTKKSHLERLEAVGFRLDTQNKRETIENNRQRDWQSLVDVEAIDPTIPGIYAIDWQGTVAVRIAEDGTASMIATGRYDSKLNHRVWARIA